MIDFKFRPAFVGPSRGSLAASSEMAARRRSMDEAGQHASTGVRTVPFEQGPGHSEWVLPDKGQGAGHILFLHGSGFSKGSPASHRPLVARIVEAAGIGALVPDYRLTPEHRYPAALEDALAVYAWLVEHYPADSIAVIGDSAGGGLGIATVLAARDAGLPLPAALVTLSAWTDLAVTGDPREDVCDPRVTQAMLRSAAVLYLDGADPLHPYASPLYADFRGFPPMLMQVGGREIMIEDTMRLANAARTAGADVETAIFPGMAHVFQLNQPDEPQSADAIAAIASFVRAKLGADS